MSQHVKATVFEFTPSLNFNLTTWQSYQAFAKKKASLRYVTWIGVKCPFSRASVFNFDCNPSRQTKPTKMQFLLQQEASTIHLFDSTFLYLASSIGNCLNAHGVGEC